MDCSTPRNAKLVQNTVLLIIDVQKGFDETCWGTSEIIQMRKSNIAKLLITWRETNRPVIHIQHLSLLPDSPLRSGYSGSEIKDIVKPNGNIVSKNVNSAFIGTGLEDHLKKTKLY